jgi:hypothetical protein
MIRLCGPDVTGFQCCKGFTELNIGNRCTVNRLQLTQMLDDLDQNSESEKCCPQLSTYFKRHMGVKKADESLQAKHDIFFKPALLRSK